MELSNNIPKQENHFPTSVENIYHLSKYNELPPPPPAQMVSSMTITSHTTTVTINPECDYVNCTGGILGRVGDDNISEEGKLLACVRDDSVTYASTCDIEPPLPPPPIQPTELKNKTYSSIIVNRVPPRISETATSPVSHDLFANAIIRGVGQTNEIHVSICI